MSETGTTPNLAAPQDLRRFESLVEIMRLLRSPQGCPWDQEQTHQSLARYAVEESYELMEAIEDRAENLQRSATAHATREVSHLTTSSQSQLNPYTQEMVDELGDLLLQVVFHAEMGRAAGEFTIEDVVESINSKMIFRHPHVFGDASVKDSGEVLDNWAKLKEIEAGRKQTRKKKSIFGIPPHLPALEQAAKIGEKTHQAKFDWPDVPGVLLKMREEIEELEEAVAEGTMDQHEHEIGDVLFTVAQLARHLKLNAEQSLRKANRRFETRYQRMLELMTTAGVSLAGASDDDKELFWQKAKAQLKSAESHD